MYECFHVLVLTVPTLCMYVWGGRGRIIEVVICMNP